MKKTIKERINEVCNDKEFIKIKLEEKDINESLDYKSINELIYSACSNLASYYVEEEKQNAFVLAHTGVLEYASKIDDYSLKEEFDHYYSLLNKLDEATCLYSLYLTKYEEYYCYNNFKTDLKNISILDCKNMVNLTRNIIEYFNSFKSVKSKYAMNKNSDILLNKMGKVTICDDHLVLIGEYNYENTVLLLTYYTYLKEVLNEESYINVLCIYDPNKGKEYSILSNLLINPFLSLIKDNVL